MKLTYIDTAAELDALCAKLRDATILAVDTEFLREKTYYAELCLIQVATADLIACIDPIALKEIGPFLEHLYDPAKLKVMHAARQDLELFQQSAGGIPGPVFDTQIAAGLVGHAPQIGYGPLVEALLDVSLAKAHTRTNWKRRPLSPEQIEYAADDVRYLLAVHELLHEQLRQAGRLDWALEDNRLLGEEALYVTDPLDAWQRVKGSGRLTTEQRRVLQALAAWREVEAMRRNLPRRWVVADEILVTLARSPASTRAELRNVDGLTDKLVARLGDGILQAINADAPELPPLPDMAAPPTREQRAEVRRLAQIARDTASELAIDSALLATQRDLQAIVAGKRDLPVLTGWRREQVGTRLLEAHAGR